MLDSLVRVSRRVGWVTDKTSRPGAARLDRKHSHHKTEARDWTLDQAAQMLQLGKLEAGTFSITVKAIALGTLEQDTRCCNTAGHRLQANATPSLPLMRSLRNAPAKLGYDHRPQTCTLQPTTPGLVGLNLSD